jgi:CubicO group peptidase (beta-lactamase class C family)
VRDAEARRHLDALIERGRSPGVQYLFLSADETLFAYNGGLARLPGRVPVTDRTSFNAYSVTKTFTAAAILQLAALGRIDLDRPIREYVVGFPYAQSPTVRETLTHTGGFPSPNPLPWAHLAEEHAAFDEARFVDEVLRKHSRLSAAPGAKYSYSNVGYLVLGQAIAQVSGESYTDCVERHLIRPLTLGDGEALAFSIAQPESHARGYLKRWSLLNLAVGIFIDRHRFIDARAGRWVQFRNLQVNGAAYGGLIGNARGFARYLQALLGRGDYLSPSIRAQLFTPARGRDGTELARSLGWFAGAVRGETYFAHAGGAAGYYCEIRVYPRLQRASVVMFNRTGIRDQRVLDGIDRFFLGPSQEGRAPLGLCRSAW